MSHRVGRGIWIGSVGLVGFGVWMGAFALLYEDPPGPTPWMSLVPLLVAILVFVSVTVSVVGFLGRRYVGGQDLRDAWRASVIDSLIASYLVCPALFCMNVLAQGYVNCAVGSGC